LIDLIRRQAGAVEGISVSGGEPFDQPAGLGLLLQGAHAAGLSTLVYTGYALADLRLRQDLAAFALRHIDILVDGPYRAVLAEHDRVASSNQAVHFLSPRYPPAILADPHDWPAREILVEGTESILHTGIW
jgi:anaerobic ribonucleoside-triphosphate reductase activating protein